MRPSSSEAKEASRGGNTGHLQARDEMVGWDAVTRSQRLKLVVQLRRFLVLAATRRPNLASQCLGAGLR